MDRAFASYHPSVIFAYFACAIGISMAAFQPVFIALSFLGATATSLVVRGARSTARTVPILLLLWLTAAIANPFFSSSGSTEILRLGERAIYAEAVLYGVCSGCLLATVMLWFASFAKSLDAERQLTLFGSFAPTTTLLVNQTMRLVPQFVSRMRSITLTHEAATFAASQTAIERIRARFRAISILMGWSMEDGLIRSQQMRARGYGATRKRTTYRRYRFSLRDGVALACIIELALVSAALAFAACQQFEFYPKTSTLVSWWGYAPYAVLMAVPACARVREWFRWL